MIKISKDNVVYEYNSLNDAIKQNGAVSGMNKASALRYLEKIGFDVASLQEELGVASSNKASRTPAEIAIVEKVIALSKVIDNDKIKALELQIKNDIETAETDKEVKAVKLLIKQVKDLKNPVIDKASVLAKFESLYDSYVEYQAKQEAQAQEAQAQEAKNETEAVE